MTPRAPLFLAGCLALALSCAGGARAQIMRPLLPVYPLPDHSPATLEKEFGGGMWQNTQSFSVEKMETIPQPLTPKYQAMKDQQTRNRAEGKEILTTDNRCIPQGMPRMMHQAAFEVYVRPFEFGMITSNFQVRNVFTDGRKHTPDDELFDSFSGESIGHWEGDVLVVTTTGLRETNEVLYGVPGHKVTTEERIYKTGPDALQIQTKVIDPVVFTTPWTYVINYRRNAKATLSDVNYCVHAFDREINNAGVEGFDLTPPPDPREAQ